MWKALGAAVAGHWRLLLALLAAALVIRFFRLGHGELWLDEVLVYLDAKAGTFQHLSRAHRVHLGAVGWILNHVGDSPFWLRAWGALTGSLAVPALAVAGLWFEGRRSAVVWGLLAALNPFLVFYAQDANYYGTMMLLASVQVALFVAFFRGAPLGSLTGIVLAGLISFYNHPFSIILTALAAGGCVAGSLVVPRLRRQIYDLSPRRWLTNPAIPLIALFVIVAAPVLANVWSGVYQTFQSRLALGQAPRNVEFTLDFFRDTFVAYGVTYFRPGPAADVLVWIPFLLFVGGVVAMLWRGRAVKPAIPLAILAVATPALAFLAIFNLRHHGFYYRYFTFFMPLFVAGIGWCCVAAGEWLAARLPKTRSVPNYALAGVVMLVQVPHLAAYLFADRSNFRGLAETLDAHWQPGEQVFIPEHNDWVQASYYLGAASGRSIWPEDTRVLDPGRNYNYIRRTVLLHRLYGKEDAWVVSAWRPPEYSELWAFLDEGMPPVHASRSPHGEQQDARLHRWSYGRRALLRAAGTRFQDTDLETTGRSQWFAQGRGAWRIHSLDGHTSATLTLTPAASGQAQTLTLDGSTVFSTDADTVVDVTLSPPREVGRIQAEPAFPDTFELGPFELVNYPDDSRHRESEFEGVPVLERAFDGRVSYVLWVPPGEERHLVLNAVRRTREALEEKTGVEEMNPDLLFAVAADGVHMGTWLLSHGDREELARIVTDIKLPPGNHRIDIHGQSLRYGYAPRNNWLWAGLEWNAGAAPRPERSIEDWGMPFLTFPLPVMPWNEPGSDELSPHVLEISPAYRVRVSPDVTGPSGLRALEIDFSGELRGPADSYHRIVGPLLQAQPGALLAFSTYARMEDTGSHAFALTVVEFDEQGQAVDTKIGDQQLMVAPFELGWRRFVQLYMMREGVAAVASGIVIFPPDPDRIALKGRIHVDGLASMTQARNRFAHLNLDPGLFFEVEEEE